MCSVVGYIGHRQSCTIVVEGLQRLEYRGYDSSGFACIDQDTKKLSCVKATGRLENLIQRLQEKPLKGIVGVGHTRWSTHGVASEANAHPHFGCQGFISIVHNGIIENFAELKQELEAEGHVFRSETDSEVIAHLFEQLYTSIKKYDQALFQLARRLQGAFAVVIMMQEHPDVLLALRKNSPLCIGVGKEEMFIASDILAFAGRTNDVLFLPDSTSAIITAQEAQVYNFFGDLQYVATQHVDTTWLSSGKQGDTKYDDQ